MSGALAKLCVGDQVVYRDSYSANNEPMTVVALEQTHEPGSKYGEEAESVLWDSTFIADLDTGHFAYAHQIRPLTEEEAVHD